jgi:transposase
VRVELYQAAIAAIRHCPRMKAFYAGLKARGKASRVAIIAVARKLLVLANALIWDSKPYQAPANSLC